MIWSFCDKVSNGDVSVKYLSQSNNCLQSAFLKGSLFEEVVPLCEQSWQLISEVFASPDSVMGKLIQHIFQQKIQVSNVFARVKDLFKSSEKWLGFTFRKILGWET